MKKLFLSLLISFSSISIFAQGLDYKPFPEWEWGIEDSTEYFLYTPSDLEPGKKYPIALFMHGCCGKSLHASARNAVDPPARMWHNFGANEQQIPTYIISAATNRGWSKHFASLKNVIDFLVEKRQGDPTRIYVTGFSMGGRGTFEFISEYPDLFAAALPMGMSFFNGDFDKIKDIPVWANRGSEDWHARELPKFVRETRALNGLVLDSALETITGVNPRYTSFEGVGHGVQWHAASTQDLIGWAYSKVNDGNKYPHVYFSTPTYRQEAKKNKEFAVEMMASDPDGSIAKVDLFMNKKYHSTLTNSPFKTAIKPEAGDNILEAVAYDDKGKTSTATTVLVIDTEPALMKSSLPFARVGAYYSYWIPVKGNGQLTFSVSDLPEGLTLLPDGLLRGIPMKAGSFKLKTTIEDEDGDKSTETINIEIKAPRPEEVLVSNAIDVNQHTVPVSKMIYNEEPNFNPAQKPNSFTGEINFSGLNNYYGLTFIKTDVNDSTPASQDYLSFTVDRDVKVMVGYEKFDRLYQSTIPEWLQGFTKEKEEVVAQFRYFGVYSKTFPKGKITLPGGDKKGNGMSMNYFVMLQPAEVNTSPEINISQLPDASANTWYQTNLTALYGFGKLEWKLTSGNLPEGLAMNSNGNVKGIPMQAGVFSFTIQAVDEKDQISEAQITLKIE